ncbi:MAG: thiolase family protein [Actinomycetota bacterium]|nr:thiolase family protein [Actinomycetota bacterium]
MAFAGVDVLGLAAPLLAESAASITGMNPVDEVILGNCMGPGGNIARAASLAAGLGVQTPGVTVDRQCGSGLEAVAQAAALLRSGAARTVLAGGVESASTAPWRFWPPTESGAELRRYTQAPFAPDGFPDPSMGAGADALARHLGISRERQDAYAARSHRLAARSVSSGTFDAEIVAVQGFLQDQRPRDGITIERLGRLPAAFGIDGTATAGNSCGVSDGAAVLTVVAEPGAPGLAILDVVTVGCDPAMPGLGAAAAISELLRANGLRPADIGAVEITEAFASVALAAIELTGLDESTVCADGGAIGYGHPWGASGAVLLVRLFARMMRTDGQRLGIAGCAIGGGLGTAMLVERVG